MLLPERQCGDKTTDSLKARQGCIARLVIPLEFDGESMWECPLKPMCTNRAYYAFLFDRFGAWNKHGVLPEEGGLGSQPEKLMMIFRVMAVAMSDADKQEREGRRK